MDYEIKKEGKDIIFYRHKNPPLKANIVKGESPEKTVYTFRLGEEHYHLDILDTYGKPLEHMHSVRKNAGKSIVQLFIDNNLWYLLKKVD